MLAVMFMFVYIGCHVYVSLHRLSCFCLFYDGSHGLFQVMWISFSSRVMLAVMFPSFYLLPCFCFLFILAVMFMFFLFVVTFLFVLF